MHAAKRSLRRRLPLAVRVPQRGVSDGLFEPADSPFRAAFDGSFRLSDHPTTPPADAISRQALKRQLHSTVAQIAKAQRKLFPSDYSVLLVFQAMDAAGKDSTISAVLSGVNPCGLQVSSFRRPSDEDLGHDPFWRYGYKMPEKGMIGVFNRSYYEKVLVLRVHPTYLDEERPVRHEEVARMPPCTPHALWDERFETIRDQERYLARNGTIVLKFMLNVSPEMQARRFLRRIDDPSRNWKFSAADMSERQHWDLYQTAYQDAIAATSTPHAPWYVIPADSKPFMKATVAQIVADTLKKLNLQEPLVTEGKLARFAIAREKLHRELQGAGCEVPSYSSLTRGRDLEHDVGVANETTERSRDAIESLRQTSWRSLTKGQRSAAKVLGFSEHTWDFNNELDPDIGELYWGELTLLEQGAAQTLGLEEQSWEREKLSFGRFENGESRGAASSSRLMSAYSNTGPFSTLAGSGKVGPSGVARGRR